VRLYAGRLPETWVKVGDHPSGAVLARHIDDPVLRHARLR